MTLKAVLLSVVVCATTLFSLAQSNAPLIGAQVYIEPGQTKEQIDHWFGILAQNEMRVSRLFIMWEYMEPEKGNWDFTLYDWAFDAAKKHNIKIVATLMTGRGPSCRGFYYSPQNDGLPTTQEWLNESAEGIEAVVKHFKNHPALDHWMLMNEPGQWPSPDSLAVQRFRIHLKSKYGDINALNKAWITKFGSFEAIAYHPKWADAKSGFAWPTAYFDWNYFWREHMTWYMAWVAGEIRKHDTKTPLHVNPHGLLDIYHTYELHKWKNFLSSVGASIHPVWHFGLLKRENFDFGVSFVSEMMKGVSSPNPFWVTELQGGNNGYSGAYPITPGYEETARWIWSGIASGAQRVVFWCLNYRMQGGEAAEWSMLNYDNSPSPRLKAAGEAAKVLKEQASFFQTAQPVPAKVVILLSPESGFVAKHKAAGEDDHERSRTAHMKEALGVAMALSGKGIPYALKMTDDLNSEKPAPGTLYILPHAISLTNGQINLIADLVTKAGAKLLITGLSGAYDEYEKSRFLYANNPFSELTGITVLNTNEYGESHLMTIGNRQVPFLRWACNLKVGKNASAIAQINGETTAATVKAGKGEITWIPATIGMGAWLKGAGPLSDLFTALYPELSSPVGTLPFHPNMQVKMLEGNKIRVAMLSNSGDSNIQLPGNVVKAKKWYSTAGNKYVSEYLLPGELRIVEIK